ncbi:MAG: methyltransferase domain-containing protein [Rubrivivax sp.]|nr:methyltransferase domain-containing protein [Rubrivivax sp.]
MAREPSIIELGPWLQSAPGRYLLEWELGQLDRAVTDAFGFHALQLGMPEIDALRANRMPHRWVANDTATMPLPSPPTAGGPGPLADLPTALICEFEALPFPADSIDLVVLPHSLEFAQDPHQLLREVERVLRPEGRVVITGLNPASLWGLRQRASQARLGIGPQRGHSPMPREGEFIGYWRLRDWLRLLGFVIEDGRFGCWRPPMNTERWLERCAWMDRVGERWWPVLGATYLLVGVKRVKGMRLVGLVPKRARKSRAGAVVATQRGSSTLIESQATRRRTVWTRW